VTQVAEVGHRRGQPGIDVERAAVQRLGLGGVGAILGGARLDEAGVRGGPEVGLGRLVADRAGDRVLERRRRRRGQRLDDLPAQRRQVERHHDLAGARRERDVVGRGHDRLAVGAHSQAQRGVGVAGQRLAQRLEVLADASAPTARRPAGPWRP
jgi:hypothetical protein